MEGSASGTSPSLPVSRGHHTEQHTALDWNSLEHSPREALEQEPSPSLPAPAQFLGPPRSLPPSSCGFSLCLCVLSCLCQGHSCCIEGAPKPSLASRPCSRVRSLPPNRGWAVDVSLWGTKPSPQHHPRTTEGSADSRGPALGRTPGGTGSVRSVSPCPLCPKLVLKVFPVLPRVGRASSQPEALPPLRRGERGARAARGAQPPLPGLDKPELGGGLADLAEADK